MAATGERQLPGKARKGESGSQETCLRSQATSTLEERVPLMHIHSLKRAALAACVFVVLAASPAIADAVTTKLRVEADGHDIGPGFRYVHDSVTYETSAACGGTGDSYTIDGPSALGLAIPGGRLHPRRCVRCRSATSSTSASSYAASAASWAATRRSGATRSTTSLPEVGADQFPINRSHGEVLWYFVTSTPARTSGNELELVLSDNVVQAGTPVDVTVREYDDERRRPSPAAGVRLEGAAT